MVSVMMLSCYYGQLFCYSVAIMVSFFDAQLLLWSVFLCSVAIMVSCYDAQLLLWSVVMILSCYYGQLLLC